MVKLEERVDFSPWVIEGFGTSDVIVISNNVLEIIISILVHFIIKTEFTKFISINLVTY